MINIDMVDRHVVTKGNHIGIKKQKIGSKRAGAYRGEVIDALLPN
jgi:hypothetical protein